MKTQAVSLALACVSLITVGAVADDLNAPAFQNVLIQDAPAVAEPSITTDPTDPDRIYVAGPSGNWSRVWRSMDRGLTWEEGFHSLGTSGDTDIAVDADGTVYVSDLFPNVPVSVSTLHGALFERVTRAGNDDGSYDRQWTAASGHGRVVQTVNDANLGGYVAWISHDAAETFDGPHMIVEGHSLAGPPVFAPDGTMWAPFTLPNNRVGVARSTDGTSWLPTTVASFDSPAAHPALNSTYLFPVLAIDEAGGLYLVWSAVIPGSLPGTAEVARIFISTSSDGGETWSPKRMISDPAYTSIFPWVAAGAPGKVAVSWFRASDRMPSNLGTAQTTWDVMFSQSLDALSAEPTWTSTVAASRVHTGSICTEGTGCGAGAGNIPRPLDRRALDFFEMTIDADGYALIVYNRDVAVDPTVPGTIRSASPQLMIARQYGGPSLR